MNLLERSNRVGAGRPCGAEGTGMGSGAEGTGTGRGTGGGTGTGRGTGRERLERYSLTGQENRAAVDAGLAGGAWFRSAVPRKRMKELMQRSDYPAVRGTIVWPGPNPPPG